MLPLLLIWTLFLHLVSSISFILHVFAFVYVVAVYCSRLLLLLTVNSFIKHSQTLAQPVNFFSFCIHIWSITISLAFLKLRSSITKEKSNLSCCCFYRDGLKFYLYLAHSCPMKVEEHEADPVAWVYLWQAPMDVL